MRVRDSLSSPQGSGAYKSTQINMTTQTFINQLEAIKPTDLQSLIKTLSTNKQKLTPEQELQKKILEMEISTIDFLNDF